VRDSQQSFIIFASSLIESGTIDRIEQTKEKVDENERKKGRRKGEERESGGSRAGLNLLPPPPP
jgi:hypothetical protein